MELEDFMITAAAALLGFISLFKNLLVFIRWLHATFLRKPKNLCEYGSWAVVTGPIDGIGKALAFELVSKGLNLVLVGRNLNKLEPTTSELRWTYANEIQVKTVVADLAKLSGEEIEAVIGEATEGLDVGAVVNNGGLAYPYPRYFREVDRELMESMLRVNLNAVMWVTKGVIDGMSKKKREAILNIGSASSVYLSSYPLQTLYASTKTYIPLFLATKMTMLRRRTMPCRLSRCSVE
ncbi:hypothetical protein ACJRO7_033270 [Eucalyptus globulus]|uniref:Uncharacterized protein n=1 Tax=Eucalyptus globulus TaxID=34317 RepID=A0ABD3JS99_EUCGL